MNTRLSHVILTLGKELRETLRDRRTIAVMILFPMIVYPLLALLVSQVVVAREKRREARAAKVAVLGQGQSADDLRGRIRRSAGTLMLAESGDAADVEGGRIDALLAVLGAEPARHVEVVYDATRDDSREAAERVQDLLARALAPECIRFDVKKRDLASKTNLGGYLLSKALPLVVILMVMLGGFYPAIDATAGERERGTLETVLCAPVRRFDLLLGKVLAVAFIAALTGILNLASMTLTLIQIAKLGGAAMLLPVPWGRTVAAALVVLPAAFLFASIFVTIGSVARGFKEAQNLLMPVYFAAIAPALVGAVGDYALAGATALVPVMNVTLLARDLMLGKATGVGVVMAIGSTAVYGALALWLAVRVYDSERFVEPRPRDRRGGSEGGATHPTHLPVAPTAGEALSLFALAFVLLYFVFVPLQQKHLVGGMLFSQGVGLLGLPVLLARISGRQVLPMIALRPPPPAALLGAGLIGAGAWAAVALLSERLVPVPKEFLEQLRRALVDNNRGLVVNLALFALTPAICEEVFFRGVVLRGLGTRLSPAAAALVTGALFGLFHLDLYRLLPSAVLGVLLSFIAQSSRSLVPAMFAHFLNNAILLLLATTHLDQRLSGLGRAASAGLLASSVTLTALGVLILRRNAAKNETYAA